MRRTSPRKRVRSIPPRKLVNSIGPGRIAVIFLGITFLAVVAFAYRPSARLSQTMPPVHQEHLDRTSLDSHKAQNGVAAVRTEVGTFKVCGRKPFNCVVDGDTFWLEGVKIRVADIDTPEIRSPKCTAEKALGVRATRRFMELLNDGPFTLRSSNGGNRDRYGRLLRIVERDGQSLGSQLVDEGLAHEWAGRRLTWCGEAH